MINKFIGSLLAKLKKQGFTLTEALIITIMTGYCLLPILGTMQNAQNRTNNYDHHSKMLQYARSRLTAEIANASFDHKSVNIDDEYNYVLYYDEGGDESNAKIYEYYKTKVSLEDLDSLHKDNSYEWATSAVELFDIDIGDSAVKPYVAVIYAYKTSVEVNDKPRLASDTTSSSEAFDAPKGLLGLVVRTSLLKSNDDEYFEEDGYLKIKTVIPPPESDPEGESTILITKDESVQVPPVCLFSFVNLPSVSEEFIWLADAYNLRIYCLDPLSKAVSNTIYLPREKDKSVDHQKNHPNRPWHIAVHPNLKMLAVMRKKGFYLVNIDIKGSKFGLLKEFYNDTSDLVLSDKPNKIGSQAFDDGAIAFRPDGKYLFCYSPKQKRLYTYKVNYLINNTDNTLTWNDSSPSLSIEHNSAALGNDKIHGFIPSNDGFLYMALANEIIRFPMYPTDWNDSWGLETSSEKGELFIKTSDKIISIDISPDCSRLSVVMDAPPSSKKIVRIYDTRDKKLLKENNNFVDTPSPSSPSFTEPYEVRMFSSSTSTDNIGSNSLYLGITNQHKGNINQTWLSRIFDELTATTTKNIRASDTEDVSIEVKSGHIVVSPDSRSMVINDIEKPFVYFTSTNVDGDEIIEETDNSVYQYLGDSKIKNNCSDLATSKRDLMAVAAGQDIQLYDLSSFSKLENEKKSFTKNISSLALSPQGDILIGGYSTAETGMFKLHLKDKTFTEGSSGKRKKIVFDDRVPNMLFFLENPRGTALEELDAFWNYNNSDNDWLGADAAYNRKDFNLPESWNRLDMIAMPKGGAMVLYGKNDGSSMIEWIGRRNWEQDPNKGKYKLFARWTSPKTPFEENMELPSGGYNPSSITGDVDGWEGRIELLKTETFPVHSIVKSLTAYAGNDFEGSGDARYFTPVIVELNLADNTFSIKDVAEPFGLVPGGIIIDNEIIWTKNGGKIENANYRVGFWNGSASGPCKGALRYSENTAGKYYADYYKKDNGDSEEGAVISYEDLIDSTVIFAEYPSPETNDKIRNYSISFKSVMAKDVTIFPPNYSKKIAISPDCGILAILSGNEYGTNSKLSLYDFNNHIYETETQIEGMLVDYREPFHSGAWNGYSIVPQTYGWPQETDTNLFKRVNNDCVFYSRPGTDSYNISLAEATTKYDSWKSFNKYPGNYWLDSSSSLTGLNSSKKETNRRLFGYFRPEWDIKQLQRGGTEDIRFFINKLFSYGRTEVSGELALRPNPINFTVDENDSTLLQIDETCNKGASIGGLFVSSSTTAFTDLPFSFTAGSSSDSLVKAYEDSSDGSTYYEKIKTGLENKFDYIYSSQTYILKNYPTLMWASSTTGLINSAQMIFSRDRANPVLYIIDSENQSFCAVGYSGNKIDMPFKKNGPDLANITSNPIITSDGQKLLFSIGEKLNVYNIASTSALSPSVMSISFDVPAGSKVLANKTLGSFSSSKLGGTYKAINKSDFSSYPLSMNGAMTVASGGIYIYNHNVNGFLCYNPVTDYIASYPNVLKRSAPYCPITSYDDNIFVFGNDGSGASDPISDRVQSFNPTTEEALCSLNKEVTVNLTSSYYMTSINKNPGDSYTNIREVTVDSGNNSDRYNIFDYMTSVWYSSVGDTNAKITYEYKNNYPFIVNSIIVWNEVTYGGWFSRSIGVKDFKFYGITDSNSEVLLCSGTMPKHDKKNFDFNNSTPYRKYRFECVNSHDNAGTPWDRRVGVEEIAFYRKKVNLLTPTNTNWIPLDYSPNYKRFKNSISVSGSSDIQIEVSTADEPQYNPGGGWGAPGTYYYLDNLFKNTDYWQNTDYYKNTYILFSYSQNTIINILRLADYRSDNYFPEDITIYGSNGISVGSIDDTLEMYTDPATGVATNTCVNPANYPSIWTEVANFTGLKGSNATFTLEFNNINPYNYYLIKVNSCYDSSHSNENDKKFAISRLELWNDDGSIDFVDIPTSNYLTPLLTDDLGSVNVGAGAVCATPYGLVYAGGHVSGTGENYATDKTLVYWPHAVNRYDGNFYEYGISRTLPPLQQKRFNHSLVWHKGRIYAIGGAKNENHDLASGDFFAEYLDPNNREIKWVKIPTASYTFISDGFVMSDMARYYHGACSFGDEIFVFGGYKSKSSSKLETAFAWNPETGIVRKLRNIPTREAPCAAVAFGSKIYIYGDGKMYEYTP